MQYRAYMSCSYIMYNYDTDMDAMSLHMCLYHVVIGYITFTRVDCYALQRLQHTATHRITLQRTATRCNTLPHNTSHV